MKAWYETAENIAKTTHHSDASLVRCTCCDRPLRGHAIRMLELDQRTDTYHDHGDVPEDSSQGWFPFGLACAKKTIKKHDAKVARQ